MADSAFPVGGFAYSYGLESAVKHGFISNQDDLREYLITYSEQLISFDFPFIASAHALDKLNLNGYQIRELLTSYEAMLLNPPIRKASCVMGKNWLKICKQLNQTTLIEDLDTLFMKEQFSYEFPIVYGCSMNHLNFSLPKTLQLFFYMAIRDQISALIRLGVAGPSRAHSELKLLMEIFREKIDNYEPQHFDEAYKSAYLLEIAQLKHDQVYSKLFQN